MKNIIFNKEWIEIVARWNSREIQDTLDVMIQSLRGGNPKLPPYISKFFALISSFAAAIHYHAYGYDNLTYVLHYSLYNKLREIYRENKSDSQFQSMKLKELLKSMPKTIRNFHIVNGILLTPNGKNISPRNANEILDFMLTDQFLVIMRNIRREGLKSSSHNPTYAFDYRKKESTK